jgi:hypothetical protein
MSSPTKQICSRRKPRRRAISSTQAPFAATFWWISTKSSSSAREATGVRAAAGDDAEFQDRRTVRSGPRAVACVVAARIVAVGEHDDAPVGQDAVGVHQDQPHQARSLDDVPRDRSHPVSLLEQLRAPEIVDLEHADEPPLRIGDGERGDLPVLEDAQRLAGERLGAIVTGLVVIADETGRRAAVRFAAYGGADRRRSGSPPAESPCRRRRSCRDPWPTSP